MGGGGGGELMQMHPVDYAKGVGLLPACVRACVRACVCVCMSLSLSLCNLT